MHTKPISHMGAWTNHRPRPYQCTVIDNKFRFLKSLLSSDNVLIQYVTRIAIGNARSPIGNKYAFYRDKYGIDFADKLSCNIHKIIVHHSLNIEKQSIVLNILTLFDILHLNCTLPGFNDYMYDQRPHSPLKLIFTCT